MQLSIIAGFPPRSPFSRRVYRFLCWCVSARVRRGQSARGRPDLRLQSLLLRVSWNPGRHSQAMPPFCVSLQMCAQPWFLSMQVGPSFAPSICTVEETETVPLLFMMERLILREASSTCKKMAPPEMNCDLRSRVPVDSWWLTDSVPFNNDSNTCWNMLVCSGHRRRKG